MLDPAAIPDELFLCHIHPGDLPEGFSTSRAAGAGLFQDPDLFKGAARALEDVGLVARRGATLTMHGLVQRCVRELTGTKTPGRQVTVEEWATLVQVLQWRFVEHSGEHSHKGLLQLLAPSVSGVYNLDDYVIQTHMQRADFASGLGRYHRQESGKAHWAEALPLFKQALEIREAKLGPTVPLRHGDQPR